MRRFARPLGTLLVLAGVGMLAWSLAVWAWKDPFTAAYTLWQQDRLERSYEGRLAAVGVDVSTAFDISVSTKTLRLTEEQRKELAAAARKYRKSLREGDAIGRLEVPRLGVDMVMVEGTAPATLQKGPARYRKSFLPAEGELIYVAGHRTTFGAPFSRIDRLREGDRVFVDVPYGRFEYRITRHRIVRADQIEVLKSKGVEELALQACHPRFFASHRYIAYAVPVGVEVRGSVYRVPERVAAGA